MDGTEKNGERRMRTKGTSRRFSMRWRMIMILLICWMIPFAFMIGILGVYLAGNHSEMTAENFQEHLAFNNKICVERLNGAVAASRQASYDGTLLASNEAFRNGKKSQMKARREYREYLTAKYQKNDAISSVVLWFDGEDGESVYSVYNERANGSYQQVRSFREEDFEAAEAAARPLGTGICFLMRDGRLYLLRNLMDSHYERKGTLVFCLNGAYCFNSLAEYPIADGVYVSLDGNVLEMGGSERLKEWAEGGNGTADGRTTGRQEAADSEGTGQQEETADSSKLPEPGYAWLGGRLCVSDRQKGDSYTLYTAMLLQKEVTQYPFYGYQYVVGAMLVSLIPMLLLIMRVFRTQVTDPVSVLSEGARQIERGELGYQIAEPVGSLEFTYLRDSFNQMSSNLKQQFDRIYQEEIALREARIMALQSHINPHFMNNTLEIINWEARLGGNEKVSKMIGALSTMLDAALDRHSRPLVKLSEEMVYVDAYLYITKERLGSRLTVEKQLPEEVMDCLVPRLILQPVIENAIEHGVVPNGSGVVVLRSGCSGDYLYLEVMNDGGLSAEDRARVNRLLDPDYNPGSEPSGNLGIANVNQRLRILYGPGCGLSITEKEKGQVTARLTMSLQR